MPRPAHDSGEKRGGVGEGVIIKLEFFFSNNFSLKFGRSLMMLPVRFTRIFFLLAGGF